MPGINSKVNVAKLQCKTGGKGPCLVWTEGRNTVWLRLQSYNVKLLSMVLVCSGGGLGTQSG